MTSAGKRKAQKALAKYEKITGKKIHINNDTIKTNSNKKSIKDMTNEELDAKIRRKEKENRYRQLYPEKVSRGKRFMNATKDVMKTGLREGAKEGVKNIVSNVIKNIGDDFIKTNTKKKKTK